MEKPARLVNVTGSLDALLRHAHREQRRRAGADRVARTVEEDDVLVGLAAVGQGPSPAPGAGVTATSKEVQPRGGSRTGRRDGVAAQPGGTTTRTSPSAAASTRSEASETARPPGTARACTLNGW